MENPPVYICTPTPFHFLAKAPRNELQKLAWAIGTVDVPVIMKTVCKSSAGELIFLFFLYFPVAFLKYTSIVRLGTT